MRYQVIVAHRTNVGRERKENQDAVGHCYDQRTDCHLLIVADGMGGAACGSRASRFAVETIGRVFFEQQSRLLPIPERLNRSFIAANHAIWQDALRDVGCRGMGSTCVVLALISDRAYIAHVGDSRIYQVEPMRVVRLTRDHSHVQRMLDSGLITEEEAGSHPDRNRIERALGPREIAKPEIRPDFISLRDGDAFVLCTDGLSGLVRDEEIFGIVLNAPADQACETLVALANERGGHDNITVAVARIGDDVTRAF